MANSISLAENHIVDYFRASYHPVESDPLNSLKQAFGLYSRLVDTPTRERITIV